MGIVVGAAGKTRRAVIAMVGLRRAWLAWAMLLPGCATILGADFDRPARAKDAGADAAESSESRTEPGVESGSCAVVCAPPGRDACVSATTLRKVEVRGCGPDGCEYPTYDVECPEGCKDGACVGRDPCAGVSCTEPPPAVCATGGKLVTLSKGRCVEGKCSFVATETACANGCEAGACKGEPCAGVMCQSPPPAVCANATTRRSYASTGMCTNGACSYTPTDTTCANGCENGVCKSDLCAGVVCTQAPGPVCVNGTTRRTYAAAGVCQGGNCTYAPTDEACANGCVNGACNTPPVGSCPNGMCLIPAGTFQMGSTNGYSNEQPVHAVTLAAYELDEFEVTVSQYAGCVTAGGCTAADTAGGCNAGVSGRDNHPINCVDWNQATTYCAWAGKRLPTEEEWEYAARGPDGREYPWGNVAPGNQLCWSGGGTNRSSTCAVGSYPSGKSPFGVQDMAGNVEEWVSSLYTSNYSSQPTGSARVYRGGSWGNSAASNVRSADRLGYASSNQDDDLGFRCAR
jgi:formylglycine-generating enzyme required for sulfatase activity